MPRYADARTCPDCRAAIVVGSTRCPTCHLSLTGPLPRELFATLTRADELLTALRATSTVTAPALTAPAAPRHPLPAAPPLPPGARPGLRLPGVAVPRILLGLGAVCLLVAALVFSVVAWRTLGLGGRTAVLAAVTLLAAAAATGSVRRGLPAAAEALTAVTAGLVTLDLAGAGRAGWLGDASALVVSTVTGGVLLLLGAAAATAARRSPRPRLVAAEAVAALGLLVGTVSGSQLLDGPRPVAELAGLVVTAAAAGAAYRLGLLVLAALGGVTAVGWWAVLLLDGLVTCLAHPSLAALAGHGRAWPVLAATAALAAPAGLARLPQPVRTGAVAGALGLLVVLAGVPAVDEPAQVGTLVALVVLVGSSLGAVVLPHRWAVAVVVPAALGGVAAAVVVVVQSVLVADRLAVGAPWSEPAGVRLPELPSVPGWPALVVPVVLALGVTATALVRLAGPAASLARLVVPATVALTLATSVAVAAHPVPRWCVLVVLVLGAAGSVAAGPTRRLPVVGAGLLALVALAVALPSAALTLLPLAVLLALAVVVELVGHPGLREGAQALLPVVVGVLAVDAGRLGGLSAGPLGLAAVVAVGVLVVARPTVPLLATAALTAVGAVGAVGAGPEWVAVDLVVGGVLVLTAGLLHRRPALVGAGTVLLLGGSWVRLADLGVTTVDAYTLPLAALLLAVGGHRMRRHGADSLPALAPGLALALTPTLLLALAEPVSVRAVVLGLACAGLVLVGTGLRWSAPLAFGAGAGVLLVLREAAYADVVPQWVVIGALGLLLTGLGVTWEQRLQDLRLATGYLRALR